jgi:hypothetical protein
METYVEIGLDFPFLVSSSCLIVFCRRTSGFSGIGACSAVSNTRARLIQPLRFIQSKLIEHSMRDEKQDVRYDCSFSLYVCLP